MITSRRSRALRYVAGLALAGAVTPGVRAAEWATSPTITMEANWLDNPRLEIRHNNEQVSGALLNVDALFARNTPTTAISLRPRLRSSMYSDADDLESTDRFLDFALDRKGTQTGWSLATQVAEDTTLVTELDTTGIVDTSRRQQLATLRSSFYRMLSSRTSIGGEISEQDVNYGDTAGTELVDFSYTSAAVVGKFNASERTHLNATLRSGELDAPQIRINQRDYAITVGVERNLNSRWSVNVNGGPSRVEVRGGASDSGMLFGVEANGNGERISTRISLVRSLLPTGRGVITQRDRFILSLSRTLNERASIGIAIQRIETTDLVPELSVAFEDRTYNRAELRFEHRFGLQWNASVAAVWADQQYQSFADADQRQAVVSFTWRGRAAISR